MASYIDIYRSEKGGFDFGNTMRNKLLEASSSGKGPVFTKTGTTIIGLHFDGGVILAADTRATAGELVMIKNCKKVDSLAPNICGAGCGTAADMESVGYIMKSNLELLRLNENRPSQVSTLVTRLCNLLFRYNGYISAGFLIGGYDCKGPQLFSVSPNGYSVSLPFAADGSGTYAAIAVLESRYRDNLPREEAIDIAAEAIEGGIFNDLGSGSNVDITIITKDKVELLRNYKKAAYKLYNRKIPPHLPAGQTRSFSP